MLYTKSLRKFLEFLKKHLYFHKYSCFTYTNVAQDLHIHLLQLQITSSIYLKGWLQILIFLIEFVVSPVVALVTKISLKNMSIMFFNIPEISVKFVKYFSRYSSKYLKSKVPVWPYSVYFCVSLVTVNIKCIRFFRFCLQTRRILENPRKCIIKLFPPSIFVRVQFLINHEFHIYVNYLMYYWQTIYVNKSVTFVPL